MGDCVDLVQVVRREAWGVLDDQEPELVRKIVPIEVYAAVGQQVGVSAPWRRLNRPILPVLPEILWESTANTAVLHGGCPEILKP